MEILSDSIFKGNVKIDGGEFSITRSDNSNPLIETNNYSVSVNGSEIVESLSIRYDAHIHDSAYIDKRLFLNGSSISNWACLNNILSFAPSSLSTTVSSLSSTVSSNTTKINSLCTTVASISGNKSFYTSFTLPNTIDASCGKFTIGLKDYTNYAKDVCIEGASLEGNGAPFVFDDWSNLRVDEAFRINNRNIQKIRVTDPNTNKDLLIDVYGSKNDQNGTTEFFVENSTNYELPAGTRFTIYYTIN